MVDWSKIIREIQNSDYRLIDIAVECGTHETTLCDLLYGRTKEPRYTLGSALLSLHVRVYVPHEYGNSAVDN